MPTFEYESTLIHAEDGDSVLGALLRQGVQVENRCGAGACQSCILRTSGVAPTSAQVGLDESLIELGAFLSCQAKADSVQSVEPLGDHLFPDYPATLVHANRVSDDVLIVSLQVPGWSAAPGRFIRLKHSSGVSRPYSLATPAWESPELVQLHVRIIPGGEMSEILTRAVPGDSFALVGPFGKCRYKTTSKDEPILLIGSGTGLAPLYGVATDAIQRAHRGPIHLYHGAATSSRLYYREELRALGTKSSAFHYSGCADAEVTGNDRVGSPLTHALQEHPNLEGYKVYLCGHPALVRTAQRKCFLAGANMRDIAADPFEAS